MNTRSKVILVIALCFMILTAIICFILITTSSATNFIVKVNSLKMKIGESVNISQIVDNKNCEIEILSPNILQLRDDKLVALDYGEAIVNFTYQNITNSVNVSVYALNAYFDKASITLYENSSLLNYSILPLYIDNNIYNKDFKFYYDDNIITYDGNVVRAVSIGNTTIKAIIEGVDADIVLTCDVSVKKLGYVNSVDTSIINMVIDDNIEFNRINYDEGDLVKAKVSYDESFISIVDNKISALRCGESEIIVDAQLSDESYKRFVIPIKIEPKLVVESLDFYSGDTMVDKLMVNYKADKTLDEYMLKIVTNRKINSMPNITNINVLDYKINENEVLVYFNKINLDKITITLVDEINLSTYHYACEIEITEYLQNIHYDFVLPNEVSSHTLYLFNKDYETQANNDNYYDYGYLEILEDVDIYYDDEIISYTNGVIKALNVGGTVISLTAKDNSNLVVSFTLEILAIQLNNIIVEPIESVELSNEFTLSYSIEPIYALSNIEVLCDNEYIKCSSNYYQAIKCGNTEIKIIDKLSNITASTNIVITKPNFEIVVNGQTAEKLQLQNKETVSIDIIGEYDTIKYYHNAEITDACDIVEVLDWAEKFFVTARNIGEVDMIFYNLGVEIYRLHIIII